MSTRREKNKPQPSMQNPSPVKAVKEKNDLAIEFGKFLLDLAKLTFGGMFLTAILDVSFDMNKVIMWCAIVILILAVVGFIFVGIGNKKR